MPQIMLNNPPIQNFVHIHELLHKHSERVIPVTWLEVQKTASKFSVGKSIASRSTQDFTRRHIAWQERLNKTISEYRQVLQDNYEVMQRRGELVLQQLFAASDIVLDLREIGMDVVSEGSLSFTFYLPTGRLHVNTYTNFDEDPDDTTVDFYADGDRVNWQWEGPATQLENVLQQAVVA